MIPFIYDVLPYIIIEDINNKVNTRLSLQREYDIVSFIFKLYSRYNKKYIISELQKCILKKYENLQSQSMLHSNNTIASGGIVQLSVSHRQIFKFESLSNVNERLAGITYIIVYSLFNCQEGRMKFKYRQASYSATIIVLRIYGYSLTGTNYPWILQEGHAGHSLGSWGESVAVAVPTPSLAVFEAGACCVCFVLLGGCIDEFFLLVEVNWRSVCIIDTGVRDASVGRNLFVLSDGSELTCLHMDDSR